MTGEVVQFAASLLAVLGLIGLTWLLGFRQEARLASAQEVIELMRLAPGGFEPESITVDNRGRSAIGRDQAGRLLVLVPHGNRFVARLLGPHDRLEEAPGELRVSIGGRQLTIELESGESDSDVPDAGLAG